MNSNAVTRADPHVSPRNNCHATADVWAHIDFRMGSAFQREVLRRSLHAALEEASANELG